MDNESPDDATCQISGFPSGVWGGWNTALPVLPRVKDANTPSSTQTTISSDSSFRNTAGQATRGDSVLHEGGFTHPEYRTRDLLIERWVVDRLEEVRKLHESESRGSIQDFLAALIDTLEAFLLGEYASSSSGDMCD